jgi:hypothetical protein
VSHSNFGERPTCLRRNNGITRSPLKDQISTLGSLHPGRADRSVVLPKTVATVGVLGGSCANLEPRGRPEQKPAHASRRNSGGRAFSELPNVRVPEMTRNTADIRRIHLSIWNTRQKTI